MNTQHLQYIIEIERTRSISQAAENLFLGQPNLSRILHDMEQSLGFRIFERSTRGVRPTTRGTIFLQHAKSILRETEAIEALGPKRAVANRLRVCLPRSAAMLDLTAQYLAGLPQTEPVDAVIRECHARKALELLANGAQIFADVRTYWSPEATKRVTGYDVAGKAKDNGGIIHLLNSGAACLAACGECTDENGSAVMKRWWEVTDEDIQKMTDATVWCEAGFDNFRGGGFSSHFVTRAEMPATMIRLNLVKGLGPVLQIAEGWTVKLPEEVTDTLMERTNPTWPCTWFTPRCDGKAGSPFESAYSVMQNWGANHGAISYGHVGADLITLCSMLRIPVCMHNVADQDIFRPAAWNAFGMDKEGQDYRACAAYGPMYKNIR